MFKHVDLCSGIGGFSLGFQWAGLSEPVLFCDTDAWCRKVLAKHWPDVPIAEDVKELANDPDGFVPDCDILTAGYPCQPFSQAGKRGGAEDDRHIWPEIFTIIQAKRPTWIVCENVFGHISLGLDQVLSDLESKGYAVQPFVVPACAVDAPHRRDRVWIVAYAQNHGHKFRTDTGREGQTHQQEQRPSVRSKPSRPSEDVAEWQDAEDAGQSPRGQKHGGWDFEPAVGRLANGLSTRLDGFDGWEREPEDIPRVATGVKDRANRLRGLGNAIVPAIAMRIGQTIKAVH